MHTVSASFVLQQMDSTHTRTPSMSKPLDEYALLNFDGLEVVSSSLVLKLSSKISLPFHLTFALMVHILSLLCCSEDEIRRAF